MATSQSRVTTTAAPVLQLVPDVPEVTPRLRGAAARRVTLAARLAVDVLMAGTGLVAASLLSAGTGGHLAALPVAALAAWIALAAWFGLYDDRRVANAFDELKLALQTAAAGTVAAAFAALLLEVSVGRAWVLATWALSTGATVAGRLVLRRVLRRLRLRRFLGARMLVVGSGAQGRDLVESLTSKARWLGYDVVGFVDDDKAVGPVGNRLPEVVGSIDELKELVAELDIDDVLVAGEVHPADAERVYRELAGVTVELHLSTGLLGVAANRVSVQRWGDAPVLGLRRVDLNGFQQLLKRVFDVLVAGTAVLVLAPVLLACALAVKLSSPGPVLFTQRRVGKDGREFTIHKFRSMVADAEDRLAELRGRNQADGLLFKLTDDPRVTRVGRFMRAWSLDELPQLFDVLGGRMSLVGPRPPLPDEVARYDDWIRNRLRVKPGLTGLWQVSGRHQTSFADYIRHDLFYVENWSLAMDLFIVLRTIPAVLARSGV